MEGGGRSDQFCFSNTKVLREEAGVPSSTCSQGNDSGTTLSSAISISVLTSGSY